jgi:hypothetical protein
MAPGEVVVAGAPSEDHCGRKESEAILADVGPFLAKPVPGSFPGNTPAKPLGSRLFGWPS